MQIADALDTGTLLRQPMHVQYRYIFLHFVVGQILYLIDRIKGIVSRVWGGLLIVSVDRYEVLDVPVPAKYLFLILMSSSYVKFYICMLGQYVSLLLGGLRHKTPSGAILNGSPSLSERSKSAKLSPPDIPAPQEQL
jgi:hypothetical protein